MGGDAASGFQDVAGDCEFMGGCANIAGGVMENEVFEMNQFTIDPQRCARVGEVRAFDKTLAHGRTGNALIETGQCDRRCGFYFEVSNWKSSLGC